MQKSKLAYQGTNYALDQWQSYDRDQSMAAGTTWTNVLQILLQTELVLYCWTSCGIAVDICIDQHWYMHENLMYIRGNANNSMSNTYHFWQRTLAWLSNSVQPNSGCRRSDDCEPQTHPTCGLLVYHKSVQPRQAWQVGQGEILR